MLWPALFVTTLLGFATPAGAQTVSAGYYHACAIASGGALKCWGSGGTGVLGQGNTAGHGGTAGTMGDVVAVIDLGPGRAARSLAIGGNSSCAVLDDRSIACWGINFQGETGNGSNGGGLILVGDQPGEMGIALGRVQLGF